MATELRQIIREAFNAAYVKHKTQKLNESVDGLKSKMSSGDIYKVENVYRKIKKNPDLAYQYAWVPQGSANGELNPNQFNLLAEMLFEGTDMEEKSRIFMQLYNKDNPALVNWIGAKLTGLKGTNVTREEALDAAEIAWDEMFLGVETKTGEKIKKSFPDAINEYISTLNKKGAQSNFGAYLMTRLKSSASNSLRDVSAMEKAASLDAPSLSTGKPRDICGETGEDFGSDIEHQSMNVDKEMGGLGAGLEKSTGEFNGSQDLEPEEENDPFLDTDEEMDSETLGGELGNTASGEEYSDSEKKARIMIRRMEKSLYQAIEEYRSYENPSENQEKGFKALEIVLSGINQKEAIEKFKKDAILKGMSKEEAEKEAKKINITTAIQDLKKNKRFVSMVDDYLLANGFVNSRGKVDSFMNMYPQWIADAVKFKQTGKLPQEFSDDRRTYSYASVEPEEETNDTSMKSMHKLIIITKKVIKALKQSGNESKVVSAIETLLTGTDPETTAKNMGYENTEKLDQDINSIPQLKDVTAQNIADSAKSLKTGSFTKAVPVYSDIEGLSEVKTFWFLEKLMNEKFINKNLDKIMENVYKKLAKNI